MFDVSDEDLDGLEERSRAPEGPRAFEPFLGESAEAPPQPAASSAPLAPVPAPSLAPAPATAPSSGAGRALIFATGGLIAGALVGGAWGAAAGVVGVGAVRNLARVRALWQSPVEAERAEATKSATIGIVGVGLAGTLGYQAYKAKRGMK